MGERNKVPVAVSSSSRQKLENHCYTFDLIAAILNLFLKDFPLVKTFYSFRLEKHECTRFNFFDYAY